MATRNVIGRTQLALVWDGGADGGAVLASGLYFAIDLFAVLWRVAGVGTIALVLINKLHERALAFRG